MNRLKELTLQLAFLLWAVFILVVQLILIGILILLLGRCNYAVGLFGNFEPAVSRFCRRFWGFRADHAAFSSS